MMLQAFQNRNHKLMKKNFSVGNLTSKGKSAVNFHRTLFSSLPAIRRLLKLAGKENFPLISAYLTKKQLPINKKKGVECLRLEIKQYLARGTL